MMLKLEVCVYVLRTIMNSDKYDYCFICDHSNDQERLRPDGLNLKKISKNYGSKQPNWRCTTIKDELYLNPFKKT